MSKYCTACMQSINEVTEDAARLKRLILDLLKAGPMHAEQVAAALNISVDAAKNHMNRLVHYGLIVSQQHQMPGDSCRRWFGYPKEDAERVAN